MYEKRSRQSAQNSYLAPVIFLALCFLWLRLEDIVLFQVDAVVYSDIAKELSRRPISEWASLSWRGISYYEHPPLMKWILALFIRLFGSTSMAVVLPAVIFSTLTVLVTFLLSKELLNERYALVSSLLLCTTPAFIRNGRNPMLEPPLMFFIVTSVYCGTLFCKTKRLLFAWCSGFALSAGLLTKGPPALIVLPTIWWLLHAFRLELRSLLRFTLSAVCATALPLLLFEWWHYSTTTKLFTIQYFLTQITSAASQNTPQSGDWLFYGRDCFTRQWPWLGLALVAPFIILIRRRSDHRLALGVSLILWAGPLVAFSFFNKKSTWYADITLPGLAMLATLSLLGWVEIRRLERLFARSAIFLGIGTLFAGATLPSLFKYPRPVETFFHELSKNPSLTKYKNQNIADCIGLDPWKGPSFLSYYLDSHLVNCDSPVASYRLQADPSTAGFQSESLLLTKIKK